MRDTLMDEDLAAFADDLTKEIFKPEINESKTAFSLTGLKGSTVTLFEVSDVSIAIGFADGSAVGVVWDDEVEALRVIPGRIKTGAVQ